MSNETIALQERIAFAEVARDNVIAQLDELTGRVAALRAAHGERTSALVDLVRALIKQLPAEDAASASQKLHDVLRTRATAPVATDSGCPDEYTLACCEHGRWSLIASLIESGLAKEMLKVPFGSLAPYQQDFFFRASRAALNAYNLRLPSDGERDKEQGASREQADEQ